MTDRIPTFLPSSLILVFLLAVAAMPAAAQYTTVAQAPLSGDVAVGSLPASAGGHEWTHGSGTTVDIGQTFLAPADFSLHAVTVRVAAEGGVAGREVAFQILELGPGGDPASGTPLAITSSDLPQTLSAGVTLYLTLRLPSPVELEEGTRYAFLLHFEGGGNVNDARARLLHGGADVYPEGVAFEREGGFLRTLAADLLFLVHGGPDTAPCVPDGLTLCLQQERFRVSATFSADGVLYEGAGAVGLTPDTGYFWFFEPDNVELVTKLLAGCPVNDRYWVFTAGLTDVEVFVRVADTERVLPPVQNYHNGLRTQFQPILDAAAFATCP